MAIAKLTHEQTEKTKDVAHKLAEKMVAYIGRTFMEQERMTKEDMEHIIYNDVASMSLLGLEKEKHEGTRREMQVQRQC